MVSFLTVTDAWQTPAAPPRSGPPKWLWLIGGCAAFGMVGAFSLCGLALCMTGGAEGGVRYSNNMEDYATRYLQEHQLLHPGERVVAYYDATIALDGTESVILTDNRLVYHRSGLNSEMAVADIVAIRHSEDPLRGDLIDVTSRDGGMMHIEVAPFNGGEGFLRVLRERAPRRF